jgi:FMN-dependent oxidoreductase (nitrilotriacetate monooxygenase family)
MQPGPVEDNTRMAKQREMALVGFLQAQNCSNYVGSWRHPGSATDFLGVEYYQRMARTLEHGKFHLGFFDDRLAMPDILGHSHVEAVRNGVRVVKMDPCTILTCMGMATTHLGLGSTYSTTYYEPFHVARVFATLDLMVGGRAAWNVVTSLNSSEAQNFGEAEHPEHDLRYDRADEFMEVVLGHWDSWEDDAIVVDKETGLFAHPEKVHPLNHNGQWFRSKGPFTVPRSPQGRPVVIQAGHSGRGRDFAARWGELVFCVYSNVEMGRKAYKVFKDEVARYGRDPDGVSICPATYIIVGETKTIAEDKRAMIDKLARPIDALALLSEALNFDFASKPMDQAFTNEELKNISGLRGILDRVVLLSGKTNPTLGDFVHYSKRGTIGEHPVFCATPKEVADQMEEWFTNCCDGFVFAATSLPGTYEDIVRLVVPELQRRGLHQKEYKGKTLRENLRLPKAQIGDWKRA